MLFKTLNCSASLVQDSKMYKQIILLTLLVSLSNAQLKPLKGWTNCGSPLAIVNEIRVTDCEQTPCEIIGGKVYDFEVDATSLTSSQSLTYKISAFNSSVILLSGNACDKLTAGECPVSPEEKYTFKSNFDVPVFAESKNTVITGEVLNDSGDIGICVNIDVTLAPTADTNK